MRGLPRLVVVQVLYGLQQRTRRGCKTVRTFLRRVCDLLRQSQAIRIEDSAAPADRGQRDVWSELVTHARRTVQQPETEVVKDVWDGAVLGRRGFVTFTDISQPWLREATKRWAADYLPRLRTQQANSIVQTHVNAVAALSRSLRAGRRNDRGNVLSEVGRRDIEAFLQRLTLQRSRGELTENHHVDLCRRLRRTLARMRTMGLTRPGRLLHGLPDDFVMHAEDVPAAPDPGEPGRDLPAELMRQLCEQLPRLEDIAGRDVRVAVDLLIDTGRRPYEVTGLRLDCLTRDSDGGPVLLYDNGKAARLQRRLPIAEATADLIIGQQQVVRARYPNTPASELALFPSPQTNPDGRRSIVESTVADWHRKWVAAISLTTTDNTPVDRSGIVPYCYRHTYAQRHADAGVPIDVLRQLLDHKRLDTTKRYYRVGEQRRRAAVDKVTAVQFDRHGARIWREAQAMLDSERARRAIGEVVVPFGVCSEPTNVAAGGHDCPIRFRCLGCDHFSTDVSYLPDLEAYLSDLLRNRERILAMTAADAWAKAEAAPSDEEITRVRRLIHRVKTDLDQHTPAERAQIDAAITVVRAHRPVSLGMPRIRPTQPDIARERTA